MLRFGPRPDLDLGPYSLEGERGLDPIFLGKLDHGLGRKSDVGLGCAGGPSRLGSVDPEDGGPREGTDGQVEPTLLGPAGHGKEGEKFLGLDNMGSLRLMR